jgi:hypothetical protein
MKVLYENIYGRIEESQGNIWKSGALAENVLTLSTAVATLRNTRELVK